MTNVQSDLYRSYRYTCIDITTKIRIVFEQLGFLSQNFELRYFQKPQIEFSKIRQLKFLGEKSELRFLELHNSNFCGKIPSCVCRHYTTRILAIKIRVQVWVLEISPLELSGRNQSSTLRKLQNRDFVNLNLNKKFQSKENC